MYKRQGEHLTTIPPYGYMKDPNNKKKWIIDEEAAAVVQQIFALCVSGMGPTPVSYTHLDVYKRQAYFPYGKLCKQYEQH